MTNGDAIRKMKVTFSGESDEELCNFLFAVQKCDSCILNFDYCDANKADNLSMFNAECKKNGMRWLKAESEEKD